METTNNSSKYVKMLVEGYFDSTDSLNQVLKDAKKYQREREKEVDNRRFFIQSVIGKKLYNRYTNNGMFAPVMLSAIKLTERDFSLLIKNETVDDKTDKLVSYVSSYYPNKDFKLVDGHRDDRVIKTDITFSTIDDMIDFFYNILRAFKKTYHTENVFWRPIVQRFKEHLQESSI